VSLILQLPVNLEISVPQPLQDCVHNCRSGLLNGSTKARDCNGYLDENRRTAVTQKLLDLSNTTFDLQSVVSMEILESDLAYVEARNEEVCTFQSCVMFSVLTLHLLLHENTHVALCMACAWNNLSSNFRNSVLKG
jgi:hypothetical protein